MIISLSTCFLPQATYLLHFRGFWIFYFSIINEEILVESNFVLAISETVIQEKIESVIITGSADVALSTQFVLQSEIGNFIVTKTIFIQN